MSHILIIEDDKDIALMVNHALRPLNCPIDMANDGAEALNLLTSLRPGIVVLDLNLPYVRGEEILGAIRRDPQLAQTKVVIFSVYSEEYLGKHLEYRPDAALQKPHALGDLREAVKTFVM